MNPSQDPQAFLFRTIQGQATLVRRIAKSLHQKGVTVWLRNLKAGGIEVAVPIAQASSLPEDGEGRYFGTGGQGFSLFPRNPKSQKHWDEFATGEWESVG